MRLILCGLLVMSAGALAGQQQPDASTKKNQVAAIAGKHTISVKRVERHLKKTLGKIDVADEFLLRAKAESLDHLICRHVVLESIRAQDVKAGEAEIRIESEKLNDRLKEVGQSIDDYLEKSGLSKKELEYEFEWRIAWKKYLKKHLTDDKLTKFFNDHRRQFDGTQLRVAHLLIQSLDSDIAANLKKAQMIRDEIGSGKTSWTDAVKKNSEAKSSSDDGGEIGWIGYDGPMPESFCHAAIDLQPDELSLPVETVFGVHLIKCLEVRPGKIGPRDAIDDVRNEATRFLFNSLAEKNRAAVPVQYKVDWPVDKKPLEDPGWP